MTLETNDTQGRENTWYNDAAAKDIKETRKRIVQNAISIAKKDVFKCFIKHMAAAGKVQIPSSLNDSS